MRTTKHYLEFLTERASIMRSQSGLKSFSEEENQWKRYAQLRMVKRQGTPIS